ncbi:MAG TPA: hypothetical protein VIM51_13650 [Desulfosporosinus sp.]
MERWENIGQPRVTTALKSISKESFLSLAVEFKDIMGFEIKPIWIDYPHRVSLSYVSHRGKGYFKFNTHLYDKPTEFYDRYSQSQINSPAVVINDFILEPNGQGFGTKIITRFIEEISTTSFPLIYLRAIDERAANFWGKFGFLPIANTSEHMPSMKLQV